MFVSSFPFLRSAWWAALMCAITAWLLAGITAPALRAQAASLTGPGVSAE